MFRCQGAGIRDAKQQKPGDPPKQIFVHRNIAKYVAQEHSLILLCARLSEVLACIFNSSSYASVCHSPSSFKYRDHDRSVTDRYLSVNFTSQTTTPFLFSPTELLASMATPSQRFASSDTPIVLVSKLATMQSEASIPSPQIQYFGHGLDPLGNLPD